MTITSNAPKSAVPGNFRQYHGSTGRPIRPRAPSFVMSNPKPWPCRPSVADARPGKVALVQSPFYPGGGGQLADRGVIRWQGGEAKVVGFEVSAGKLWHLLDSQSEIAGSVEAAVDPDFRRMMRQLHTDTHVLNALVFQSFDGALVTGVQMAEDGTARMDFDIQGADSDRLRALEGPINDLIRQDIPVRFAYVPMHEAQAEARPDPQPLCRAAADARRQGPHRRDRRPRSTGLRRPHLASTGGSPPIRILKIDNKGRHNRRSALATSTTSPEERPAGPRSKGGNPHLVEAHASKGAFKRPALRALLSMVLWPPNREKS